MTIFLIISLIAVALVIALAFMAISKNYNIYIKNRLLGEIKLEKNNRNGK